MTSEPEEEEESAPPSSEKEEGERDEEAKTEEGVPDAGPHRSASPALDADWGFPAFARDFPREKELDSLVQAYARGDYLAVRKGAAMLLAREGLDEDVKQAARVLRERTEPDRTARVFFYLAAALLVLLTTYWLTHNGPDHHISPPATPFPAPEIIK